MNRPNKAFWEKVVLMLAAGGLLFLPLFLQAKEASAGSDSIAHRGTNVQVDSRDLEPFLVKEKTEPKEKNLTFFSNDTSSVGFNDEGEPNLSTHF